jgi:hypothetical protein
VTPAIDVNVPIVPGPLRFPNQRSDLTLVGKLWAFGGNETQDIPADVVETVTNETQHRPVRHSVKGCA